VVGGDDGMFKATGARAGISVQACDFKCFCVYEHRDLRVSCVAV
jgi:hypothetical protein